MKAVLLRDTRIAYKAGETIDVSPELFEQLVETGSVEPAQEKEKPAPKKAAETKATPKKK